MIASSFQYDWKNVSYVIKNIYLIKNIDLVGCDLYTMDYIYQMSYHCSKGNLNCVHQYINLHQKQINCLIFKTNCSSIEERFKKLGDGMKKNLENLSTNSPDLTMNSYHLQIKFIKKKLIAYSKSNRMTYVIIIPCVLCPVE